MIPASITSQANCQRKSHRLTIPIQVIIEEKSYRLNNWSANGFQVENLELELKIDEIVDATLVLPTGGASILLNVKARLRNINHKLYGFEITEITERNSRVLRHYASLAIDGNYNHIDDLSSDLFMMDVASPIKEPIALTDKESKKVHRSFLKRVYFYAAFGLLFIALIFTTFLYNYLIVAHSTGLISGNSHNYNAPKDGLLQSLYVKNNQHIAKGELLFEMDTKNEKKLLENKKRQQQLLKKQLHSAKKLLTHINHTIAQKRVQMQSLGKLEKEKILSTKKAAESNYKRALYLYKRHLITSKQFSEMQNQYLHFKAQYDNIFLHQNIPTKNSLLVDQAYIKSQDQKIALQKLIDKIAIDMNLNKDDITSLQKDINASIVLSQEDAIVHNIFHKAHSYVKFSDNILTLETLQQPYILTKLLSSQIDNIYLKEPCLIYSKRLNKFFNAHVVGIGYSITQGSTTNTVEISQNEIPIRIAFDDPSVHFHLNEYLKVYFLNSSEFAKKAFRILPQNLILL
ncbi:biotin/lipoyl-binding protein [Sulfurimonas sp.]|uniref:HlyD family secretion protein n=1 Tax=Sulfurimonas sp. TaxID=2022749 RepID=UPI002638C061|nr:biotin/lipoyl-binding protein [Sulfurimonas sp.]